MNDSTSIQALLNGVEDKIRNVLQREIDKLATKLIGKPNKKLSRPAKSAPAVVADAPKRKPGRPAKAAAPAVVAGAPKRKPGRPAKAAAPAVVADAPKRKPGRPAKAAAPAVVADAPKRKPGRPAKANGVSRPRATRASGTAAALAGLN